MLTEDIRQLKTNVLYSSWQKLQNFYPMPKQSKNSLSSSKLEKYCSKKGKTLDGKFSHYLFTKFEQNVIKCGRLDFISFLLLFFYIALTTQLKENSFEYVSGKWGGEALVNPTNINYSTHGHIYCNNYLLCLQAMCVLCLDIISGT